MKKKLASLLAVMLMVTCVFVPQPAMAATDQQEPLASSITEDAVEEKNSAPAIPEGFKLKEADKNSAPAPNGTAPEIYAEGVCGDNAQFTIDENGLLRISGTGPLYDFESDWEMWLMYSYDIVDVVIEEGITSLGVGSFFHCELNSIQFPDSLTSIGEGAFAFTTVAEDIVLGSNVAEISDYAFQGVDAPSITIPASLATIGEDPFYENGFGEFIVEDGNELFTAKDGVLYTNAGKTLYSYPGGSTVESFVVPDGVTKISAYAFCLAENLKNIDFNAVKTIDSIAFAYSGIEEIIIPDTVTTVNVYAFCEMANLKKVVIGNGLKTLPEGMFAYCSALSDVKIGNNVTLIDYYAFDECTAIKTVTIPASVEYIYRGFPDTTKVVTEDKTLKDCGNGYYKIVDTVKISNKRDYEKAYAVLTKVNNERAKKGLSKLKMDKSLLETAMLRASETALCFSHTRANGSSCFGANDKMTAENIAAGQTTAKQVMNAWMNSSGHKANILSKNAKSIGIGCIYHNGTYYWVQCFGDTAAVTLNKPANKTVKTSVDLSLDIIDYMGYYQPYMKVNNTKIKGGNTTKATFVIPNAMVYGWEAIAVPGSVKWSTNNKKCSVSTTGVVKGHVYGKTTVTGKLSYFSVKKVVNVTSTVNATSGNIKYKAINNKNAACNTFTSKTAKSATVYAKVKMKGTSYNVTSIQKEAFKGKSKLKTITINSKNITFIGKDAFKGINKKATIKVPASFLNKYTKMIKNSGVANSVKIVAK